MGQAVASTAARAAALSLRDVLLEHGFGGVPAQAPGTIVLREGEVVHLTDRMYFARLENGVWYDRHWCEFVGTSRRIIARSPFHGDISFDWGGIGSIVPVDEQTIVFHFLVNALPLNMHGPHALRWLIYATARCRGIDALRPMVNHVPATSGMQPVRPAGVLEAAPEITVSWT